MTLGHLAYQAAITEAHRLDAERDAAFEAYVDARRKSDAAWQDVTRKHEAVIRAIHERGLAA